MKKSLGLIFASFVALCGLSVVSFAQNNHPKHKLNINHRQENQQDRIGQGVTSGELTAREAARLERGEVRINREEKRFRKSGDGLTLKERAKLERDLNKESQHIHNQKHDNQDIP